MIGMARAWLFGHTHNFVDLMIGSTRIVANPRGYPSEKSEFRTGFVIEV
jgi:hypothetical protein